MSTASKTRTRASKPKLAPPTLGLFRAADDDRARAPVAAVPAPAAPPARTGPPRAPGPPPEPCPAGGCDEPREGRYPLCSYHQSLVPHSLQVEEFAARKAAVDADAAAVAAHTRVLSQCIRVVAHREGRAAPGERPPWADSPEEEARRAAHLVSMGFREERSKKGSSWVYDMALLGGAREARPAPQLSAETRRLLADPIFCAPTERARADLGGASGAPIRSQKLRRPPGGYVVVGVHFQAGHSIAYRIREFQAAASAWLAGRPVTVRYAASGLCCCCGLYLDSEIPGHRPPTEEQVAAARAYRAASAGLLEVEEDEEEDEDSNPIAEPNGYEAELAGPEETEEYWLATMADDEDRRRFLDGASLWFKRVRAIAAGAARCRDMLERAKARGVDASRRRFRAKSWTRFCPGAVYVDPRARVRTPTMSALDKRRLAEYTAACLPARPRGKPAVVVEEERGAYANPDERGAYEEWTT